MAKKVLKNHLEELRKAKKITQAKLAEILGISRQSIIAIEKGDCSPSLCNAIAIAKYFGKSVEEIFPY